jgi:hypothetical protein
VLQELLGERLLLLVALERHVPLQVVLLLLVANSQDPGVVRLPLFV